MPSSRHLVTVTVLLVAAVAVGGDSPPTTRVRQAVEDVIAVLRADGLNREQRWAQVGTVINRCFDFHAMSQSVLATSWRDASAAERERFVEFFSQYLEDIYRTRIEGYTDQQIRYTGERVDGDRASVDTVIVAGAKEIPVTYRLRMNEGEWFAYDVVIEGVSLVNTYRDTFAAIARSEGMDGVLYDLKERIARHRAGQRDGAATEPGS